MITRDEKIYGAFLLIAIVLCLTVLTYLDPFTGVIAFITGAMLLGLSVFFSWITNRC